MTRIRPPVRGFGPVAPGGGAAVGAALQDVGQVLGEFGELRTNRELLDIREQEQIDRLEFAQFEKVERSEAIAQFTAKQIARNEAAAQILDKAGKIRSYKDVQQAMDVWEKGFNQDLFEGRSQEFRDIFETIDRSARVGFINKLGTDVEKGNLEIIREDFKISIQNFIEGVNASSNPVEIVEQLDELNAFGVDVGLTEAFRDPVGARRDAMEKYILSLPLIDGLAALSDEDVAKSFGEKRRELLKRDLNTKATRLRTAQDLFSAVHERTIGINIADALRRGVSATMLSSQIENDEDLSPTRKKDMLDFVDVVSRALAKGPQPISPEKLKANHVFSKKTMAELLDERERLLKIEDADEGDRQKALFDLVDEGIAVMAEATRLAAQDQFNEGELVELGFQTALLTEGLINAEADKEGFFSAAIKGLISSRLISGNAPFGNIFSQLLEKRVPNAIVVGVRRDMFLGKGRYGGLTPAQRSVMGTILAAEAINTDGSDQSMEILEAMALAQGVFDRADKRFLSSEFGLTGEPAEKVEGLIFNSGVPATEARQQPDVSDVADGIRENLSKGKTVAQIEEFARKQPRFSQEVFDRALATVGATALSGELGTLRGEKGTVSTEISITVTDPRLNDGKPTNIPTLVEGQVNVQGLVNSGQPSDEQVEIAINRAIERQERGGSLPFFKSIEEAEQAAIRRHESEERRIRR